MRSEETHLSEVSIHDILKFDRIDHKNHSTQKEESQILYLLVVVIDTY